MGERAESYPTPTLTLKNWEEILFQQYHIFLSTR